MADLKTEGRIDRIKGRIRQQWGELTDDDFDQARGNTENLIGRIKEKTGDTADNISNKLQELFDSEDGGAYEPEERV